MANSAFAKKENCHDIGLGTLENVR